MKKMLIKLMLAVSIIVFLTSAAHSELLVYEPFDYPVGDLDGCRPDPKKPNDPDISLGFGLDTWADWGGDDPSQVASGSLVHPSYNLETAGNHGVIVNGMAGSVFQQYLYDDGQDYWYSFLYQAVNLSVYAEVVSFFTDSQDNPAVLIQLNGGYPALESAHTGEWSQVDVSDPGAVMRILIKAETSGSPDTTEMCYMWVDPMPGIEPDTADADAQVEYDIPAGYSTYFFWWAGYGEDTPIFRFDEIKIGTEFSDVSSAPPCHLAYDPSPADEEVNVDSTNTILSWQPPTCLEDVTYDVYLGTEGEPNVANNPLVVDNQAVTSYDASDDVDYDTTYYWRVDVHTDANTFEGITWSFTTGPPSPTIIIEPEDLTVPVGAEAQFTVVILNEPTYTWYYSDTSEGEGTAIPDSDSATLIISNVQQANEGYYYCEATNAHGDAESFHARLLTARLMGHWKFEDNLNDEIDPANNGTSIEPVSYETGIDGQAIVISDPNQFVMIENEIGRLTSITVSAWLKPAMLEDEQVILTATEGTDNGVICLLGDGNELWGQIYGSADVGYGTLQQDQWNHCVLKYDTDSELVNLYLNGELAASTGIQPSVAPVLPGLSIGAKNSVEGGYVNGLIDDVRIYNYPVSDLDIALFYTDLVEGGTACLGNPEFDLNEDCVISILDFEILASNWANCNIVPDCQFSLP